MIDKFKYCRKHLDNINIFLLKASNDIECVNKGIISDSQLLNIQQYKFEHDRNKRLLSRSFLYAYLQSVYQIENFELEYNEYNKPYLKNNKNIDFSLSYSKDYILIAVSDKYQIGSDIEYIDQGINHNELKDIIMHQNEIQHYNQLITDEDKLDFFFEVFNTKESIIKSMGMGLYFDVKSIDTLHAFNWQVSKKIFKFKENKFKTSIAINIIKNNKQEWEC